MESILIYIIAAIITLGFTTVVTPAGVGAAFVLIPALVALGFPLLTAMSTALLLNTIAMVIATTSYMQAKLVVFKTAIPIATVTLFFSPLGARTATYMPENILTAIFICFLLFAASMIIFYKPKEREPDNSAKKLITHGIIVGTGAGFLGGLLGVGGGNIILPILIFLGFEAKKAAASTAFIVIFSSFSGFLAHASMGNIDLWLLLFCAVGSILGALLGSHLMKEKLSPKQVKFVIGIVLYIVAANMIYDLLTSVFAAV